MAINKSEYLDNLGWKPENWTVLTLEEAMPFKKVSGWQNNMYDSVKDPEGIKAFGKGALIVKIDWMEKNKAAVQQAAPEAEAPKPAAPPIPVPVATPPPVPQKLQEIADASPNVVIASIPPPPPAKEEPVKEEVKQLSDWPGFVLARVGNLIAKGWRKKEGMDDMIESPEGKVLGFEDLETMEDEEWTSHIKVAPKEKTIEEKAKEASDARQAKNEEIRKQKESEQQKPDVGNEIANQAAEVAQDSITKMAKEAAQARDDKEIDDYEASKAEQEAFEKNEGVEPSGKSVEEAVEDFKGEIVDEKTIRIEMPGPEMTTGDTGGFFSILAGLGFQQLTLSVTKLDNGKLTVVCKPQNFSGDPAYDEVAALTVTGTAEEFDKGFLEAVARPMKQVAGLMSNAENFLRDVKEKEKETKAKEAEKKEIDKLVDKAKKYHDAKDFDDKDDKKLKQAKKNWDAVIAKDPDNEDAKAGLQKIEDAVKSNAETLNL